MLQRVGKAPFLVLGRAGMDLYADPPGTRLEETSQFYTTIGGSSGNIAVGLARHGIKVSLLSCVSDDAVGRFVLSELAKYGVDTDHVVTLQGEMRTSLAVTETRLQDTQNVLYRNNAADLLLEQVHVKKTGFDDFGTLILTGTALASEPSRSATFLAIEKARIAGIPIVIDIDYRPYSWISAEVAAETYRRAAELSDVIIGNDEEFAVVAGGSDAEGKALAEGLSRQGKIAIYKMGEKGSITYTPDEGFETGIFKVDAIKPMGAGDAFMSSLMASVAVGLPLKTAVLRGSAAAAIVVSNIGCAPAMPTTVQLDTFVKEHTDQPASGLA